MKVNTPKVYTIKSNQKSTNKCLDKYINSKVKGEDNTFLNSTLKSTSIIKTKQTVDTTCKQITKQVNDFTPISQFQHDEGPRKRQSLNTLDIQSNKTASRTRICNYDTSVEELMPEELRMGMDNIKGILIGLLLGEPNNKIVILKELDEIYKTIQTEENITGFVYEEGNITQQSKTISLLKDQLSVSSNIITEFEMLKQENHMLKKKTDEGDIKYTRVTLENERLKNEVKNKTTSLDTMQKTLFQFQNNLNELGKGSGSNLNTSKSKSFFKSKTTKPVMGEQSVDYSHSIINVNDQVRDKYYLPKKVQQKQTKHELPKLFYVSNI
jgi:hypothetical protein